VAAPSSQLRPGGYFASLAGLLVILYLLVFFTGKSPKPALGLDLQGGTTVTLTAHTDSGKAPSKADLDTAQNIIENRVNGLGVANSNVVTQGNDQIVISVPGSNGDQAKALGTTAQLFFRATLAGPLDVNNPTSTTTPTPSTSPSSPSNSNSPSNSPSTSPSNSPSAKVGPSSSSSSSGHAAGRAPGEAIHAQPADYVAAPAPSSSAPKSSTTPTPSSSSSASSSLPAGVPSYLAGDMDKSCSALAKIAAQPQAKKKAVVVCDTDGKAKYVMDKPLFPGTEVKGASAQYNADATNGGQVGWSIIVSLKGHGQSIWSDYTSKNNVNVTPGALANQVGFVLDGRLLSDPEIQGAIQGDTSITGSFTASQAKTLANDFKYGALPLNFTISNAQTVSATLGSTQLKAGLLAGGIGLGLVVIYSLLYYRALGIVTIASLVTSGLLVYASVVLLGRQFDFTLTLAGIAGFIVAVGITADSFVVFFERLKEEVRGGRTMRSGVPRAWVRARRTILSADAVSFLAAAILYYLAAGDVRGFAFTLGLSTILDLVVVFLFTHPIVSVASRSKTFSSPRMSGLGKPPAVAATTTAGPSAAERAAQRHARAAKES
jgi:preprotein translocase subunit SecD